MILAELAKSLGGRRTELLELAGALQLLPSNATKWIRFERFLEVAWAVAGDPSEVPALSPREIRRLLSEPPILTPLVESQEDPYEEPFVACLSFYGGNHRVLSGGGSGLASGCQVLLNALRKAESAEMSKLAAATFLDATVLLTLSEESCRRAGLSRWTPGELKTSRPLGVPDEEALAQLRRCVRFSSSEMESLLGSGWAEMSEGLVMPSHRDLVDHDSESPTDDALCIFPLAQTLEGDTVLAFPGGVCSSILHRALVRASEASLGRWLASSIQAEMDSVVHRAAARMGWRRIGGLVGLPEPDLIGESYYLIDHDLLVHVCQVADSLDGYVLGKPFDYTDFSTARLEIDERASRVRDLTLGQGQATAVLHLVVDLPLGRSYALGFRDGAESHSTWLSVRLDHLELLSELEQDDPLGLWYFSRAADKLREAGPVMSWSALDEYAIYRGHDKSFYLSDDVPANLVSVSAGCSGELVSVEWARLDRHAAISPRDSTVVDVRRWDADDEQAVYRPEGEAKRDWLLVELDIPIWILPSEGGVPDGHLVAEVVRTIAFWVWTMREDLRPALEALAGRLESLTVEVSVATQEVTDPPNREVEPIAEWVTIDAPSDSILRIKIQAQGGMRLGSADNIGERSLASAIYEKLFALAGVPAAREFHKYRESLPLSPTKMLHVFHGDDDPLITLGLMALPRIVPEAVTQQVLDRVGELLGDKLQLDPGRISREDRTATLNGIVAGLYGELYRLLAKLRPDGLMQYLTGELEALHALRSLGDLRMASQAACFGKQSAALAGTVRLERDVISTSIALRFVIELVTAVPPRGSVPITLMRYDRALALASQIVQFGFLSDAIRFEISDPSLNVMRSNRLGFDHQDPYQRAVESFQRLRGDQSLPDAQAAFAGHWKNGSNRRSEFDLTQLNAAFRAEFGFSASEFADGVDALINATAEFPHRIARLPLDDVKRVLAEALQGNEGTATAIVAALQLGPSNGPTESGVPADSYPWRYSRDRAVTRRPLFVDSDADGVPCATWGPRAMWQARRYLFDLVASARLKASSDPMRRFIGRYRQEASDGFNHEVAEVYRSVGHVDVREQVKRFGTLRLTRANGEDIGDVDVLVVDRRQRVLLLVEVKDFAVARTPAELQHEVKKLFGDTVSHHDERLAFVRMRLQQILHELGISGNPRGWQVQGAIVTSSDLMATHLPTVTYGRLEHRLLSIRQLRETDPTRLLTHRSQRSPSNDEKRKRKKRKKRKKKR